MVQSLCSQTIVLVIGALDIKVGRVVVFVVVHRDKVVRGVAARVVSLDKLTCRTLNRFKSLFQVKVSCGVSMTINFRLSIPLFNCCLLNCRSNRQRRFNYLFI